MIIEIAVGKNIRRFLKQNTYHPPNSHEALERGKKTARGGRGGKDQDILNPTSTVRGALAELKSNKERYKVSAWRVETAAGL